MRKEITAERILEARERIGDVNDRRFEGIYALMLQCGLVGFRMAVNQAVGGQGELIQNDSAKIWLEARYHDIPLSQISFKEVQAEWHRGLNNRHKWYRWLDKIQLHHDISGLVPFTVEFQGRTLETLEQHEWLERTSDDSQKLRDEKRKVVHFFTDSAHLNPGWHLMTDEGSNAQPATLDQIAIAANFYEFADCSNWMNSDQLHLRLYTPESDRQGCQMRCPHDGFVLYKDVYYM
ncbi:MAG: hypothetical protein AAGD25_06825 [Cyanobacteria bacterium P01_F01_bin.150]